VIEPPAAVRRAGGKHLAEFQRGRVVVAQSGCLACHRIGADGNRGPGDNLTRVGSRLSRARIARALVASPEPMPLFSRLPAAKRHTLVTFLSLLR
jgi:ubiquinol-cytochrome c reductase cytochrome b subunit/menaquinol-cytochrome c reductase cytochrome b/c subunit